MTLIARKKIVRVNTQTHQISQQLLALAALSYGGS